MHVVKQCLGLSENHNVVQCCSYLLTITDEITTMKNVKPLFSNCITVRCWPGPVLRFTASFMPVRAGWPFQHRGTNRMSRLKVTLCLFQAEVSRRRGWTLRKAELKITSFILYTLWHRLKSSISVVSKFCCKPKSWEVSDKDEEVSGIRLIHLLFFHTGERGQCVLDTPPKILFCDLRLDPGESKTCEWLHNVKNMSICKNPNVWIECEGHNMVTN